MIDNTFLKRIRKMTDSELNRQVSNAYMSAYLESFGRDYGAKADAIQEYEALAREQKDRMRLEQP